MRATALFEIAAETRPGLKGACETLPKALPGFVGAGGIGEELYKVISFNYYEEISAIILLIILTVVIVDLLSEKLRHAAIGRLETAQ